MYKYYLRFDIRSCFVFINLCRYTIIALYRTICLLQIDICDVQKIPMDKQVSVNTKIAQLMKLISPLCFYYFYFVWQGGCMDFWKAIGVFR